jgi:PST family polysaccharide transporter
MATLKHKTIKGLIWSANSKFSIQIFNLVITAILARLLLPEDFGIVGMALIFTGLVSTLNETGLSSAIIQKNNINDSHLHTAFWINIFTGISLFLISYLVSPFMADFFKNAIVEPIIKVSALTFIISSVTIIHRSLLTKELNFKTLASTEISGSIISGLISIFFAYSGFGLWSLVARNVVNELIVTILTIFVYKWKPRFYFSRKSFSELFSFGINVAGSNILSYLLQNMDYIIIGRLMGAELLGYYTLAYNLAIFPTKKIGSILIRVIFPVFSIIKDDDKKYKEGYLKMVSFLSLIAIPAMIGLASVAHEFVLVVYSQKWYESILPLQILCLLGLVNSLLPISGSIFYSKGVPEIEFKLTLIKIPITALALVIGSFYGIVGVATAVSTTAIIYFIITQKSINSVVKLSWREYIEEIYIYIYTSLIMGGGIVTYKYALKLFNYDNNMVILISSTFIGITIYALLTIIYNHKIINSVKEYTNIF